MRWWTYVGTAGVMLDFSDAAGLALILSSFSRRDFSSEMILRVAIVVREMWWELMASRDVESN